MRRIRRSDAARQERLDKRLYKAVVRGNIDDVKHQLEEGARLISYGQLGTPLHAAVANGYLSIVMLLLEAGAPTNLMAETSYAPLHLACRHQHNAIVSALINYNADLNIRSKFEQRAPLHVAARVNALEITELLVAKKAKVDSTDLYGNTPLHIAGRCGHVELAKFLLDKGANPDFYDNDGWSALHYAANEGYNEMIKLLVTKKASIDQQNKYGRTPLHWACEARHVPAVETLLSLGASTIIQDRQGKFAVNTTNDTVVKQLVKLYENNVPVDAGSTTLDLHLSLKPFIRSFSRVESRESRTSGRDEVDAMNDLILMPTSPDISNSLKSMFGNDIIELINQSFGKNVDIAIVERQQGCQKYKQLLMAVASLMIDSNNQMNTLYSTVSSALQNKSQIQIIEILKVVFEKTQTIEVNLGDYQREICAAVRALTFSIKGITDSCADFAEQNESRPKLFNMQNKVDYFLQAQILEEVASLIAEHKDLWRKILPKLNHDLSQTNIKDLENRIETYSKEEKKRVTTLLNIWHIPKDLSDSDKDIDSEELCDALTEFDTNGRIREDISNLLAKYEAEQPLIKLVDLNPQVSSAKKKSRKVSFNTDSISEVESSDC